MKIIITSISFLLASVAMAGTFSLTVEDFQSDSMFDYVQVTQAEKVYSDELILMDLYQVTYLVEGKCAPTGNGDACELVPYCEYIWADMVTGANGKPFLENTEKSCDTSIEDVLDPQIIDEL